MNKPRLIDANKLLRAMDEEMAFKIRHMWSEKDISDDYALARLALEVIKEQPTAYDIQGVVEQLEALPDINQNYHSSTEMIDREDAIEIVKGGVE